MINHKIRLNAMIKMLLTKREKSLHKYVADLPSQSKVRDIAKTYGLDITHVAWEDMGRDKNSSLGPCINDLTLCVGDTNEPLIRRPNFTDLTCDIPPEKFSLTVGNELEGRQLRSVSLKEYLSDLTQFTENTKTKSLWAPRDDAGILVSTQACVLPLRDGKVEFNVQLFNYEYSKEDPQVLAIVVSDQGTSAQVITEYNQKLVFNKTGKGTNFKAQRLSDFRTTTGSTATGAMTVEEKEKNMLFIFQVPLKQTKPPRRSYSMYECCAVACCAAPGPQGMQGLVGQRGCEDAILEVGDAMGPFNGLEDLTLIRDDRYPIRCTIQYYKVTDTVELDGVFFKNLKDQLDRPYTWATDKGSLVVEGMTQRSTEPTLPPGPTIPLTVPVGTKRNSTWVAEF